MFNNYKFIDAKNIYDKYTHIYKKHHKGYVILGPPASGKTTFVNSQNDKNWIDVDDLFNELGVNWKHYSDHSQFKLNYLRADYMLEQSKLYGFKLIGSLFWEYNPDAIVIPPLDIHKIYISNRSDLDYNNVLKIRNILIQKANNNNIPIFNSCIDAVNYIDSL